MNIKIVKYIGKFGHEIEQSPEAADEPTDRPIVLEFPPIQSQSKN